MKKTVVAFSFFDPKNVIDNYVLFYLEKLNEFADIIFVADCELPVIEINKIEGLAIKIIAYRHSEYDFGSYKRALEFIKNNEYSQYDSLILCNDSCYGPFYSLSQIIQKMNERNLDFWGLTYNVESSSPHLQSFFLYFTKVVFESETFQQFFKGVKSEKSHSEIVYNYEHRLTNVLSEAKFTFDSYMKESNGYFENDPVRNWKKVIEDGFPFLKRQLFTRNPYRLRNLNSYKELIAEIDTKYNLKHIEQNLAKYETLTSPSVLETFQCGIKTRLRIFIKNSFLKKFFQSIF